LAQATGLTSCRLGPGRRAQRDPKDVTRIMRRAGAVVVALGPTCAQRSKASPFHTIARPPPLLAASASAQPRCVVRGRRANSSSPDAWSLAELRSLLASFDPEPPVARARTPPGSWYTSGAFLGAEAETVFRRNWLHVGRVDQLSHPGAFFTGTIMGQPYLVTRTDAGEIRAMFNVCAHHAAIVVAEREGRADHFVCPYHGWCYKNDGRLWKAHKVKGIQDFKARDNGLKPIQVDTLGPFVFLNFAEEALPPIAEALGESIMEPLEACGRQQHLRFVRRVEYEVPSNWKVFCDNYLDGGYHVPIAHPSLAAGLDEDSYTIIGVKNGTVQSVPAAAPPPGETVSRLSGEAKYAFAYPNFMLNRYGPWMDTNTAVPLGPDRTLVLFDYFLDEAQVREQDPDLDIEAFIASSLQASDQVQREDEHLCNIVQQGLRSRGYSAGRYVPSFEHGMHAFHRRLHSDISRLIVPSESSV